MDNEVNFTYEEAKALCSQDFLMVNKTLAKNLGLNVAVWVAEIFYKFAYFNEHDKLDDRGFFYRTQEDIEEATNLSAYQQTEILKKLKELDIIEVEKRGLPAKNYYRFNYKKLVHYLMRNNSTSATETKALDDRKSNDIYKNRINKNKEEKRCLSSINISGSEKTPDPLSVAPPQDSLKIKLTPDIKKIINYWKLLGLKLPGPTTKSYKNCVDSVKGLLDGSKLGVVYTVAQIIESIDNFKMALRHDYAPVDKVYLKTLTLDTFIYNNFNVKTDKPSMFQHCLSNPPKPLTAKPIDDIPDPDPDITNYFKNFYKREILGSSATEFSPIDESYFRQATAMLLDFYNRHRDRYVTPWWGPGDLAKVFTKVIMEYIQDRFNADTSKAETWWFKRSDFFNKRLPAYMHAQALLKEIPEIRPLSM